MNKIYIGNYNINKAYLGGDLTIKIYLGDNLVYPIEDSVAATYYDESGNTQTILCSNLITPGYLNYSDAQTIGSGFTSVVIDNCVQVIEMGGIGGGSWSTITSVTCGDSVQATSTDFLPSNTQIVVFGTGLTTVDRYSFELLHDLQSVTFNGTVPPSFHADWESSSNQTFIIYVPCNSIEAYRTALSGKTANLNDRLQCIPTPSYESKYLTIESQANNNQISFSNDIQYSVDNGSTWTTLATGNTVSLNSGDTAMFKASGITPTGADGIGHFSSTDSYKVYGNVMSLVYGDDFSGQTTMSDYQFIGLFCKNIIGQNSGLTDASNLVLPATTLTDFCYYRMFENCVNLTAAPELPSTSLDFACYAEMFQGCSSLLAAPSLPATTLANECYGDMFTYCTSLTTAPELPASVMTNQCYKGMFAGCTNLTSAPVLSSTTLANQCYQAMFNNCTSLVNAPTLPATTMAASAYTWMFDGCTGLTSAPALPATTLADWCYRGMFDGCTSLTSAPTLPATTLATACYGDMFFGCTGLTTAPTLSATTLVDRCYRDMFSGCTSLNSITCLATSISAEYCTAEWVDGVAASGTFTKAASMSSWTTGDNGIPSGWTVQDANGGGDGPSTDVPLGNTFAVKYDGQWYESHDSVREISDIERYLGSLGGDWGPGRNEVEELAIGNETSEINLDGDGWDSCTGLTLAQNVTSTNDIHNFPAMQWVNVMARELNLKEVRSGLFSDMNCCPIYVPQDYLSDYEDYWGNETTEDCEGSVADRLVAWTPYIDPNNWDDQE